MNAPSFGSLRYTDCMAGQGLRGGAGFQFQSISAGIDDEAMALVARSGLYEAPVAWMQERRAASTYPPSLAHLFDGAYVTARGVYLGAEAHGVRQGNQFTHAVTTTDPRSYGVVRPAQLWEAPWWTTEPAPTTTCGPVAADPAPGPLTVARIHQWVCDQPDGEAWLTAVHSAVDRIHGPQHRRILFISEDPEPVIRWLSAATLLLAQQQALRVGFRVFTTSPQYSQHEVLGLHPDWAGAMADPRRDHGFVVFDLVRGQHSIIEPTEAALHWVPQFISKDPLDVMDAVELAHDFAVHRAGPTADPAAVRSTSGDRAASEAVKLREPTRIRELLGTWLEQQPNDTLLQEVIEPLIAAVLDGLQDAAALRKLDTAVTGRISRSLAARLHLALLAADIDAALQSQPPVVPLPPRSGDWTPQEHAIAADLVQAAAQNVEPERMEALLATATAFGVTPNASSFDQAAHRFITWWTARPDAGVDPRQWSCGERFITMLHEDLTARLVDRPSDPEVTETVREHFWRLLWPVADDLTSPLDAQVIAAAVERGTPTVRQQVISATLACVSQTPSLAESAWSSMFWLSPPTLGELARFLTALPSHQPAPTQVGPIAAELIQQNCPTQPTAITLDILRLLSQRQCDIGQPLLGAWHEDDTKLLCWMSAMQHLPQLPPPEHSPSLRNVSPKVLEARAGDVVATLLDHVTLSEAVPAVAESGPALDELLLRHLPRTWADAGADHRRRTSAVALAFQTTRLDGDSAESSRQQLQDSVAQWIRISNKVDREQVTALLATYDASSAQHWQAFADGPSFPHKSLQGRRGTTQRVRNDASVRPTDNKQNPWLRSMRDLTRALFRRRRR
ncbi:GTPase-associated protein 1-related protein [Streptomyces lunaelactis]|uniref:GTPase-associated protein 1-related protein n=1 Tax=Streptomyces lunaelactis TaxID=1535768 RepID=UPI001584C419|nr:GTPase-associated protein 1-related protein [Streptomyces lunaelactis]NUJ99655.1 hypothetical protein [Streptomyces lunaelactis]NUK14244.1 hypothetical protein [Streptomyces lunaelactis]